MSDDYQIPVIESIKVVCRVRPLTDDEERAECKSIIDFPSEPEVNCLSIGDKTYHFDKVFQPDATQEQVYNETAKSIVSDVLDGYNGTIIAYGQMSSGKTYTMEGINDDTDKEGIIPRIVNDIFNRMCDMAKVEVFITVSYFEIYMDKIRDLLEVSNVNLSVHEYKNREPYVKGASKWSVSTPEEMIHLIELGQASRHIAAENTTDHLSRSHSVLLIYVEQENHETKTKLCGKLYLVDLASLKKVSETGPEGTMLEEANNINKSLSVLGSVISVLSDGNMIHIPYRDSKLTRILQESLGGNARTIIILCCSPANCNESDTKSTLELGRKAKSITNMVWVIEEPMEEDWKSLYEQEKEKNDRLEAELARWRARKTVNTEEQR